MTATHTHGWTSADLIYNADAHTTTTPDGREVPHVTAVLAETGVAIDFEQVMMISRRHRVTIEDRRLLGTVCHRDFHAFDDDDLIWETVDPQVMPYVMAWATCRENLGLVPLTRERQVFHRQDHFTGFLDGIFRQGRKTVLVDTKIGDPTAAAAQFQTAAYQAAYLSEHPDASVDERWAIRLQPDARVPYAITNYGRDWRTDYRKFQAFLTTFRCQPQRRVA